MQNRKTAMNIGTIITFNAEPKTKDKIAASAVNVITPNYKQQLLCF